MRDIWKEQMQTELVSDGGSTATDLPAPKVGATTATYQPSDAAECTVSLPAGAGCPSSTFVMEQQESSPNESPSSSPARVPEHNTTRVLG